MLQVVPRSLAGLACALALPTLAMLSGCADDTAPVALKQAPVAPRHTVSSTVTVTNTNASGSGSLPDAVANAADGATIGFDPSIAGQTITLTSALAISHNVTIEGPNPGGIIVSGGGTTQIISTTVGNYSVTLRNLTLTGGSVNAGGGAVVNNAGLTLDHTLVTGNSACGGGAVYNRGTVTVTNSTITGNTATTACGSVSKGGGIFSEVGGTINLINATLANNTATTGGAALYASGALETSRVTIENSIITNDCVIEGGVTETLNGTNLSDGHCGTAGAHMLVADPQLGSLADNGGPTKTMALAKTSPAIDAATACSVNTDQRYVTRPQNAACDIGAYEFNSFDLTPLTISDAVTVNPSTGAAVVNGTISCPEAFSLTLHVVLSEPQKAARVNTAVTAVGDLAINCTAGTQLWAIAIAPASGTFQNGTGSVTATTTGLPAYVLPASANAAVKLYWGHK